MSTLSQKFNLQIDTLLKGGVKEKNNYKDVSSDGKANRKSLDLFLSKLNVYWLLNATIREKNVLKIGAYN